MTFSNHQPISCIYPGTSKTREGNKNYKWFSNCGEGGRWKNSSLTPRGGTSPLNVISCMCPGWGLWLFFLNVILPHCNKRLASVVRQDNQPCLGQGVQPGAAGRLLRAELLEKGLRSAGSLERCSREKALEVLCCVRLSSPCGCRFSGVLD
ncbi:hypothetical protein H1C71_012086 [Ictidomys tridecemlineatus]|nr:hypothetical protein H1C71_012086 [Ictidomys tridecemlineatus]